MNKKKLEKISNWIVKNKMIASLLVDLLIIIIFDCFILAMIFTKGIIDYFDIAVMIIYNNIIFLSLFDLIYDVQSPGKKITCIYVCDSNKIIVNNCKLIARRLINTLLLPLTIVLILCHKKTIGDYILKTDLKVITVTNNYKICYKKFYIVLFLLLIFNIIYTFATQVNYQKTMFICAIIIILFFYSIFNFVKSKPINKLIIFILFVFFSCDIFQEFIPRNIKYKSNDSRFDYFISKANVIYNYDNDYSSTYIYEKNKKFGIVNVLEPNWFNNIEKKSLIKLNDELKYFYVYGIIVFIDDDNNNYIIENKYNEKAEQVKNKNRTFYILYLNSNKMIFDPLEGCNERIRNNIIQINGSKYKFDTCYQRFYN